MCVLSMRPEADTTTSKHGDITFQKEFSTRLREAVVIRGLTAIAGLVIGEQGIVVLSAGIVILSAAKDLCTSVGVHKNA